MVHNVSENDDGAVNDKDVYAYQLDTTDGVLRYEGTFQGYEAGNSDSSSRHLRFKIVGTVDQAGTFSDVASIEGLVGGAMGTTMPTNAGIEIQSIKGTPADGFRLLRYTVTDWAGADPLYASSVTLAEESGCYGDGGCMGNTGIEILTDADMKFLMLAPGHPTGAELFGMLAPLAFEHVTTSQSPE